MSFGYKLLSLKKNEGKKKERRKKEAYLSVNPKRKEKKKLIFKI
jgi:hypothetical protein